MTDNDDRIAIVYPVTAANGYGAAWSLAREGVPVIGLAPLKHTPIARSKMLVTYEQAPDENSDPEGLVDYLVDLGRKSRKRLILFMLSDLSAFIASTHREALEPYYIHPWMNWDQVLSTLDRKHMFEAALSSGVSLPQTWFSEDQSWSDVDLKSLPYPVMLKPMVSRFCMDGRKIQNAWTFTAKHGKAIEVHSTSQLKSILPDLIADKTPVCIQERLPCRIDDLWAHHFYAVDGEIVADFTGHKLHQIPPDFGTGTICKAALNKEIVEESIKFVRKIRFSGIGNIEYISTDSGYKFVETNPRGYYWSSLATACGVNLYKIMYDHLNGADVIRGHIQQSPRKLLWYDFDHFLDYLNYPQKRIKLFTFLTSPKMEAYASMDDFNLAIRRFYRLGKVMLKTIVRNKKRSE